MPMRAFSKLNNYLALRAGLFRLESVAQLDLEIGNLALCFEDFIAVIRLVHVVFR